MIKIKACSKWIAPKFCTAHIKFAPKYSHFNNQKSSATNFSIYFAKAQNNPPFKNTIAKESADENSNASNNATMRSNAYNESKQTCSEPGQWCSTRIFVEKSHDQIFVLKNLNQWKCSPRGMLGGSVALFIHRKSLQWQFWSFWRQCSS